MLSMMSVAIPVLEEFFIYYVLWAPLFKLLKADQKFDGRQSFPPIM